MIEATKKPGRPKGRKYQMLAVTVDQDLVKDLYDYVEKTGGTVTQLLREPVTEAIKTALFKADPNFAKDPKRIQEVKIEQEKK